MIVVCDHGMGIFSVCVGIRKCNGLFSLACSIIVCVYAGQ